MANTKQHEGVMPEHGIPHEAQADEPKATPTSDRHASETAGAGKHDGQAGNGTA